MNAPATLQRSRPLFFYNLMPSLCSKLLFRLTIMCLDIIKASTYFRLELFFTSSSATNAQQRELVEKIIGALIDDENNCSPNQNYWLGGRITPVSAYNIGLLLRHVCVGNIIINNNSNRVELFPLKYSEVEVQSSTKGEYSIIIIIITIIIIIIK